jgi:hypothetical protein
MKTQILIAALAVCTGAVHAAPSGHGNHGGHGGAAHKKEGGHLHTTKLMFSTQPTKLQAGKSAKWILKIVDDIDGTPINDFDVVHDKKLHLLIASADLSWFNHLHPDYKGKGVFEMNVTIPRAGNYRLYADYKPKERDGEVAQHAFSVGGAKPLPSQSKLVPTPLRGAWMTKTVRSGREGEPDKLTGAAYQVALMPMPAKLQAGKDVMLHFQVRDAKGQPVNVEKYLGALGHLVLLSADGKTYLHTHPMEGGHGAHSKRGSDVMFHTIFPKAGLYKAWGQFQHKGKIVTAPFVLNVAQSPKVVPAAAKSSGGVQRATVVINGGYSPASLAVQAGKPVHITFVRREKVGCGDVVKIPAAGITTKSLKPGESTTVKFTPKRSGTLRFTCGMNMYDGKIAVK